MGGGVAQGSVMLSLKCADRGGDTTIWIAVVGIPQTTFSPPAGAPLKMEEPSKEICFADYY